MHNFFPNIFIDAKSLFRDKSIFFYEYIAFKCKFCPENILAYLSQTLRQTEIKFDVHSMYNEKKKKRINLTNH